MKDDLATELASFTHDPYGFVLFAFEWGVPGTELEKFRGPEKWQANFLKKLGKDLDNFDSALRYAVASGHGVGKSALVSWLILWAMSTHEDTIGVVTANTENQLMTKTAVQLATWYRRFIGKDLFHLAATSLKSRDPAHDSTWRVDLIPWSEKNPEAFAGLHNAGKRILLIFDEASTINDLIWTTAEGAMTDAHTEIIWCAFGNPTRSSGRFFDCFHTQSRRWNPVSVDARQVTLANHKLHEEWIEDYGIESDFVKVRVLGEFPKTGSAEFISSESVRQAMAREGSQQMFDPLIMGCDIGRFGDDPTVLYRRRGRDGKTLPPILLRNSDTMIVAGRIADIYASDRLDAIFVDSGGVGGGVCDRLNQLHIPHIAVDFGGKPDGTVTLERNKYHNKRAAMWGALREWLKTGAIPPWKELEQELIAPQYYFQEKSNAIILESKKDMKARGQPSPNIADALALTFAFPVGPRQFSSDYKKAKHQVEFDPFAAMWQGSRM